MGLKVLRNCIALLSFASVFSVCTVSAVIAAVAPESRGIPEIAYPTRPIRIIVGYPPGSVNDMIARFVGAKLTKRLGQQVIVDNRSGANGIIGAELAANAAPDGHTLMFTSTAHTINPAIYKLPFDPVRSFTPLTTLGNGPLVLVTNLAFPATSVKGLIDLATAKPNGIAYATPGTGSTGHFAGALFARTAGIQLLNVPYRGGAQALTDLIGGQVQIMFSTVALVRSQIRAGRIRALGVTTAQRSPLLPEVPTIAESGVPGYEMSIWWGALAPTGVPVRIVEKLNTEIAKILGEPETAKYLDGQFIVPSTMSSAEFSRLIAFEIDKWQRVAREADIKVE
jgi:tripartite-type tricarboxylate transporter receptor subunit TctC